MTNVELGISGEAVRRLLRDSRTSRKEKEVFISGEGGKRTLQGAVGKTVHHCYRRNLAFNHASVSSIFSVERNLLRCVLCTFDATYVRKSTATDVVRSCASSIALVSFVYPASGQPQFSKSLSQPVRVAFLRRTSFQE